MLRVYVIPFFFRKVNSLQYSKLYSRTLHWERAHMLTITVMLIIFVWSYKKQNTLSERHERWIENYLMEEIENERRKGAYKKD